MIKESIGQRLRRLRQEAGMTMSDLGVVSKLDAKNLQKWETDLHIPNLCAAAQLAKTLHVSLDYLACLTDERTPPPAA